MSERVRIKKHGIHYTPPELAEFLACRIAAHLDGVADICVLDPACGDGTLLDAAAGVLSKSHSRRRRIELVGLDTNEVAVADAQQRLRKWEPDGAIVDVSSGDFLSFTDDFDRRLPLLNGTAPSARAPFDVVIANPPYVRTQVLGAVRAQELASRFGLSGRVDLYHAFLKAISAALRPGGVLGLLTSNRFLVTRAGGSMREALKGDFDLCEIYDLGDTKLFAAAVLPAIIVARKTLEGQTPPNRVLFSRVYELRRDPKNNAVRFGNVLEPLRIGFVGHFFVGPTAYEMRLGELDRKSAADSVWTLSSAQTEDWLQRVRANSACEFKDVARVRVGIKTTADKVFIRRNWEDLASSLRPEPELLHPLLTHHVAARWKVQHHVASVLYPYEQDQRTRRPVSLDRYPRANAYLNEYRSVLESRNYVIESGREWFEIWVPQNPSEWRLPKLVWPDISEVPRFFIDDTGAIVNGDCYWLRLNDGIPLDTLFLMAGVANSTFATKFYDVLFHNKLYSGRRRFITQYIQHFPLPDPDSACAREIVGQVRELILDPNSAELEASVDELVWRAFGVNQRSLEAGAAESLRSTPVPQTA